MRVSMEKESFLKISFKGFFKAFFSVLGVFAALIPVILIFSTSSEVAVKRTHIITICSDHLGQKDILPSTSKVILKINIHGVIGTNETLTTSRIHSLLVDSRLGLLKNDRIKAILLHIDTPGGTSDDSDGIYRLVKEYKEQYKIPVYAYVDGYCASGGMYIACSADKIYSTPTSIIGSVGTLMGPLFNVSDTLEKIGVVSKTLTRGLDKDVMNPFRKWKENEDQDIQPILDYYYQLFVKIVSTSRPKLTEDLLINTYGAHIFDAPKAFELGYTDGADYSYQKILKELSEIAIGKNESYQVIELKQKSVWLKDFFNASTQFLSGKTIEEILFPSKKSHALFFYLCPELAQGRF